MGNKNYLEKKELSFLEKKFAQQLTEYADLEHFPISNDRLYPRQKFLIKKIKGFINKKTKILEIGAGNFKTIKRLLDPDKNDYLYVGSDISFNALEIGKIRIKKGLFVQCNVESLPFASESFDVILSFGVLHHTYSREHNIPNLFSILRRNGLLVLHEPVKSHNQNNFLVRIARKLLSNGKDVAPMQDKLDEKTLYYYLQKEGQILVIKNEYSPVRLFLIKIFRRFITQSLALLKFILLVDDITILLSELLEISILRYGGLMTIVQKK